MVVSGVWDREPAQPGGTTRPRARSSCGPVRCARPVRDADGGRPTRRTGRTSTPGRPGRRRSPIAWTQAVQCPPVPADPTAPAAARPPQAPPLAPPPPSAPTGEVATPPRPAFVDGPPPTAVVPVVPAPAPLGGGLVDVPAGSRTPPTRPAHGRSRHRRAGRTRPGRAALDVPGPGRGAAGVHRRGPARLPVARRPGLRPVGQPNAEPTRRRDEVEPAVAPVGAPGTRSPRAGGTSRSPPSRGRGPRGRRAHASAGRGRGRSTSGGLGDLRHTRLPGRRASPPSRAGRACCGWCSTRASGSSSRATGWSATRPVGRRRHPRGRRGRPAAVGVEGSTSCSAPWTVVGSGWSTAARRTARSSSAPTAVVPRSRRARVRSWRRAGRSASGQRTVRVERV